jgi:hypothetical protein
MSYHSAVVKPMQNNTRKYSRHKIISVTKIWVWQLWVWPYNSTEISQMGLKFSRSNSCKSYEGGNDAWDIFTEQNIKH